MTTQLLIYESAVPVNPQRHRDLSVKTGDNYAFARQVNSVPLTAVEFARAATEYAIVFAGSEQAIMPAVILGAGGAENAYVTETGKWDAAYIPAFIRRYPFVFSSDADGKRFTLCLDEEFSGCNKGGRGERLFDADGDQTQYLKGVLNFLQDYQAHFRRTSAYCNKLKELDLLQPMQARFTLPQGEQRSLAGFMVVDRERLKALPAETLSELARSDELELTYLHLFSQRHFTSMAQRLRPQAAQGEAASKDDGTAAPPDPREKGDAPGGNGLSAGR